jgi:diguanylate cyclase (GGDEF)-like protein
MSAFENLFQKYASEDLNGLSENLAVELIASVEESDDFEITSTLLQLEQYENVRFALVFDESGTLLSLYLGKSLIANKTPQEIMDLSDFNIDNYTQYPLGVTNSQGRILAKKRIGEEHYSFGYLLIENDLSGPVRDSKVELLMSVLPWVIVTILFSIALILRFQDQALRPLIQLARFTRKIRDTKDYGLTAKVDGKREISVVTEGLNSMMKEINSEVEKNRQKTDLLIEQQNQLEKLANFDTLTGLPNRQFFMQKLRVAINAAKEKNSDVVLMFFDLDGFKVVNDSFGHEVGDQLLCVMAQRIQKIIGPEHLVARIGGDEFLVLLEDNPSDDYIVETAKCFIRGISEAIDIDQWNVQVGVSVGIAKASIAGFKLTELVANADIAMYRAKADGRNHYTLFTQDMIDSSRRKLKIANAINSGIINKEFTLYYQPKVDPTGKVIGYEALARWCNPELGNISPVEFIPIAEQSGKISKITEWVVEQVCIDISQILAVRDSIKIALNLSVHDLNDHHLVEMIKTQLTNYEVKAQHLEFEITESAYLDNFESANTAIEEIKDLGSSIALDDFGTGFSSLSYLTQLKLDTLKIDKQFVDEFGLSDRSTLVTKTIIDMAKQLNLKVCAEGVESLEQSHQLIENGCNILQGYYFGRPQTLDQIIAKLKTN